MRAEAPSMLLLPRIFRALSQVNSFCFLVSQTRRRSKLISLKLCNQKRIEGCQSETERTEPPLFLL